MKEYTLFCFDGPTLAHAEKFFAPDDEAAVDKVRMRLGAQEAELWAGGRKVRAFLAEAEH